MVRLSLFAVLVASLAFCVAMPAEEKYTSKYDNFDVEQVLNNQRILTSYVKCMMDEGSCTNEGRELKKHLPDALKTNCSKCTDVQKETSEKVLRFLQKNRADDFERLNKKYDPTGIYKKNILKLEKERDEELKKKQKN
ncbi:ejaculatory bulb-specific protein 3-like [Adelges cooleyi]|uniref:ejaculatory bulb-specific protein 3-like n=1 Tax=Adelges cooleyi TaxID=133065 RepID=UPI00217F979A|nr:ejaculatory bulb-specific protein 3-like [Adelges cooleyi]